MCPSVVYGSQAYIADAAESKRAFAAAIDYFEEIVLCGGEYFFWDGGMESLLSVREENHVKTIQVVTNGALLDGDKIALLKERFTGIGKEIMFAISLSGTTAAAYKDVCGSDGFDVAVENIKTARDRGALLTAVYTLSIHNQADWINAPRFFHDLGVYYTANFDSLNPGLFVNEKGDVVNSFFQAFLDEHFKYFSSLRQNTLPLIVYNGERILSSV